MPDQAGKETPIDRMRVAYETAKKSAIEVLALDPVFFACCDAIEQAKFGTPGKPKDDKKGEFFGSINQAEWDKMADEIRDPLQTALGLALDGSALRRFVGMMNDAEVNDPTKADSALMGISRLIERLKG